MCTHLYRLSLLLITFIEAMRTARRGPVQEVDGAANTVVITE